MPQCVLSYPIIFTALAYDATNLHVRMLTQRPYVPTTDRDTFATIAGRIRTASVRIGSAAPSSLATAAAVKTTSTPRQTTNSLGTRQDTPLLHHTTPYTAQPDSSGTNDKLHLNHT